MAKLTKMSGITGYAMRQISKDKRCICGSTDEDLRSVALRSSGYRGLPAGWEEIRKTEGKQP